MTTLLHRGEWVYSPIVHNHYVAETNDLGRAWEHWAEYDLTILERCDKLIVLQLDGWEESVGVRAEMDFAFSKMIPVIWHMKPIRPGITIARNPFGPRGGIL